MNRKQIIKYALWVSGISILAYALRLAAVHMYDLHIDEITYGHYAQTIDANELPRNYDGSPFFLHPPGYFVLLALWRAIFWHGGSLFSQYTVLRGLNILLAGISTGFVIGITRLLTKSKRLGYWAGLLFALDPFLIRQNTRSLMETATMLFLLIGFWLFLRNVHRPATDRRIWLSIGFTFGLAIVTKDVALNFLVLAFALMAIRKVGPPKRAFRYLLPSAFIPYGIWLAIVAISGYSSQFIDQKTVGIRRFLGLVQITGFNATNSPSKNGTLLQTIPHYASSYAIMGLGALAACWLLTSQDANRRRWGCIGVAAALVVAYLYVGGTFEEQYLYYLMVPSIISIVVGALELWYRVPVIYCVALRRLATVGVLGLIAFGITSYAINIAASPANGWQTTIGWVDKNVPDNSTICTYAQGQFLLSGHGYNICDWNSFSAIQSHHVQYIIVSEKLTNSNYEPLNVHQLAKAKKDSSVVFQYRSPDSGVFEVLKLHQSVPTPDTITPTRTIATTASSTAAVTAPTTEITGVRSTTKPSTEVASIPTPSTTLSSSSNAASASPNAEAPKVLVNTGASMTAALIVFGASAAFGTTLAYLLLYLKNRRVYRAQFWDLGEQYHQGMTPVGLLPDSSRNSSLRGMKS